MLSPELELYARKALLVKDAPAAYTQLVDALIQEEQLAAFQLLTLHDLLSIAPAPYELRVLVLALFHALDAGALCLGVADAAPLRRVIGTLAISPDCAGELSDACVRFVKRGGLHQHAWVSRVINGQAEYCPLIYDANGGGFLYFQKHFANRAAIEERLRHLLRRSGDTELPAELAGHLRDVLVERAMRLADGTPLRMAAAQELALLLGAASLAEGGLLVITGGPGTGKTSTVLNLLRVLARLGVTPDDIALAAPTGRAARRLSESIESGLAGLASPGELLAVDAGLREMSGQTLHRLLGFAPARGRFHYHSENPLPYRVLVVDEVSMVDVAMMARLLLAVDAERTLLILLGDRDQLPSVEAGAVLSDFLRLLAPAERSYSGYSDHVLAFAREYLPAFARDDGGAVAAPEAISNTRDPLMDARDPLMDRIAELHESFRSGDAILKAAAAINAGAAAPGAELPLLADAAGPGELDWPEQGCFWQSLEAGERDRLVQRWLQAHFGAQYRKLVRSFARNQSDDALRAIFVGLNRARILCVTRRGRDGVNGINSFASRWFRGVVSVGAGRSGELRPGLPLLIVRNDHRRQLYNGDVGVVLASATGELRAYFERAGERFASFPMATLPAYEIAFALSVHKSQGSEYERVLLLLPEDPGHPLLSREVLYTGLTRAKRLAVVAGNPEGLACAVGRRIIRETGGVYQIRGQAITDDLEASRE